MRKNILRIILFVFAFSSFTLHPSSFVFAAEDLKQPNVAGSFYPDDKDELGRWITRFLDDVKEDVSFKGTPKVCVSPHAGYVYSGPVAAYGYKALRDWSFDTVVILGSSHYYPFWGAAVYPRGSFRTPLGDLSIDASLADKLMEDGDGLIFSQKEYFIQEHSVETQLPFLQAVLKPGFKIVPILMGEASLEDCGRLAQALMRVAASRNVLVVASTDLSHYKTYDEAIALDAATVRYMKNMDVAGFWTAVADTGWNVCGSRPVATALLYAQGTGAQDARVLKYANSGDTAGDKRRVVGYLSLLITKSDESAKGDGSMLTDSDKKRLLAIARETVAFVSSGKDIPRFSESSPGCNLKRGVFVTLRKKEELRGCIGLFASGDPLYLSVSRMAAEAAMHDYRFEPVTPQEVSGISVEISVLTEPKEIEDWRNVRLGVDGVIVRSGSASGVFLPQVATETGWDLETFLGELCSQKAGLDRECYRSPRTKLLTFQAEIFSEEENPDGS